MVKVSIVTPTMIYEPPALSGLSWETSRKSMPGTVRLQIIDRNGLGFGLGDFLSLTDGDQDIFMGYIFKISRSEDGIVTITAYDQLRYFKNKDTKIYKSLTTGNLLRAIAQDYQLTLGECDDTGYPISRVEEDAELFDMINDSITETVRATGNLYVLWDDYGDIRLSSLDKLRVPVLIDRTSGSTFELTESIDEDTYNQIKLASGSADEGLKYYIVKDSASIAKYGLLQKYASISDEGDAKELAHKMLEMYNAPVKTLKIGKVFGDWRVRGGSSVVMKDEATGGAHYMLVENAKHTIENGAHYMDLTLKGGDVYG